MASVEYSNVLVVVVALCKKILLLGCQYFFFFAKFIVMFCELTSNCVFVFVRLSRFSYWPLDINPCENNLEQRIV